ncbi:MAG: tRNA (N6-threonylcarbamoyladenosine(37)-N6)-methyltransferase TrmO [Chloroflexi bacterium]|nr:tRNA (N6-threonylcarbamoyladenosine(37)-N6)-methyltransferase TrmO [Chloroflexota bacterium]
MELRQIGVVHSDVRSTKEMPTRGAPAQVEVFPEYAPGLLGIETNSHIVIVGWMDLADRQTLRLDRTGPDNLPIARGVFAVRSPSRPNPIGISPTRLLKVDGSVLHVERLDMVDGTPVIDIKGYSFGWDSIFGAKSFWDRVPPSERNNRVLSSIVLTLAENFHGRVCPGLVLGTRMVFHAMATWNLSYHDPELRFRVGDDGCVADAIQGATGATFGNGRLRYSPGNTFRAVWRDRELTFVVLPSPSEDIERLLTEEVEALFIVREGALSSERNERQPGYRCEG